MSEDLIQNYIDRASFSADTKFAIEQLALLEKEYTKLRDFKLSLTASTGTKDIGTAAQSATKQVQGLTTALQDQTQALGVNVKATKAEILSLEQNIAVRNRYKNTLESIKKDDKENLDLLNKGVITQDEYKKRLIESAVQQEKYKVKISEANKEIKAQINLQNTPANTIARAQSENKQLIAQRNITPVSDIEGIAKLNAQIDKNNDLIDLNSDKLGKQKINIGNYQGAANSIVDALGKQETKLQSLGSAYSSFGSQIEKQKNVISGFKGDVNSTDYKKATAELTRLETEYKKTGIEVNKTRTVIEGFRRAADISAQQSSQTQTQAGLTKSSAAYTATSQALNGYVTVLRGSRGPTKLLGEALGIGATQADTFRLVIEHTLQGIAAFFRSKKATALAAEESAAALTAETVAAGDSLIVTEAQTIAQVNLATAQGATALTTQAEATAQAELDAIMLAGSVDAEAMAIAQSNLAAAAVATTLALQAEDIAATELVAAYSADAVAAAAATTATTALATSEVAATGATTALSTALKFTGIGLLLAGIAALVYGIVKAIQSMKEASANAKILSTVFEEAGKGAGEQVAKLELLRSKIIDLKAPLAERLRALKEYNDNADKGNQLDATQINNLALVNKGIAAQISLIEKRAVAKAFENQLSEAAEKFVAAKIKNDLSAAQIEKSLGAANAEVQKTKDSYNARDILNQRDQIVLIKNKNNEEVKSTKDKFDKLLALSNQYVNSDVLITPPKEQKTKKEGSVSNLQKELNTEFEIYKLNQARLIELYKQQADDEKLPLVKRLDALNNFFIESKKLIGEQEEFDKQAKQREAQREIDNLNKDKKGKSSAQVARINQNIAIIEGNLQQELVLIEAKGNDERIKAGNSFAVARESIVKKNADKIAKIIEDTFKDLNAGADKEFSTVNLENEKNKYLELQKLDNDFKNGKIETVDKYEKLKSEIENRYNAAEIQAEINKEEEKKAIAISFGKDTVDIDEKILQLKLKQLGIEVDATKKAEEEKARIKKEIQDKEQKLLQAARDAFIAIVEGQYDREKNLIADQQLEVDKKKQRDLTANDALVQSEEKKAANIAIINARAQSQKEALDRRQKQIDYNRAVFERGISIAEIVVNTAKAVVFDLKGNKALIPLDIAIGAAQLATVLARPIPRFKTGKNDDYEGPAIVGDGGVAEYIERADGSLERTPPKDTLTYLGKDDIVHRDLMSLMMSRAMPSINFPSQKSNSFNKIETLMQAQIPLLNEISNNIKNKRENHLSAKDGALVSLWKHGANTVKYFDEQTNW